MHHRFYLFNTSVDTKELCKTCNTGLAIVTRALGSDHSKTNQHRVGLYGGDAVHGEHAGLVLPVVAHVFGCDRV
jgi:hypothetical protein